MTVRVQTQDSQMLKSYPTPLHSIWQESQLLIFLCLVGSLVSYQQLLVRSGVPLTSWPWHHCLETYGLASIQQILHSSIHPVHLRPDKKASVTTEKSQGYKRDEDIIRHHQEGKRKECRPEIHTDNKRPCSVPTVLLWASASGNAFTYITSEVFTSMQVGTYHSTHSHW